MPEVDGLAVLGAARARLAPPEVIVMTAFGTAENAVAAMKAVAAGHVTKLLGITRRRLYSMLASFGASWFGMNR